MQKFTWSQFSGKIPWLLFKTKEWGFQSKNNHNGKAQVFVIFLLASVWAVVKFMAIIFCSFQSYKTQVKLTVWKIMKKHPWKLKYVGRFPKPCFHFIVVWHLEKRLILFYLSNKYCHICGFTCCHEMREAIVKAPCRSFPPQPPRVHPPHQTQMNLNQRVTTVRGRWWGWVGHHWKRFLSLETKILFEQLFKDC